jgi:adenylosuccinate synthase
MMMRAKPLPASLKKPVPVQVVLGTQWGDEGKGKIVDLLGESVDAVVRFQGGHNAGHTVVFDGETYILHLLPTGVLRPHLQCCIGNGVVIDPDSLIQEMDDIEAKGINVRDRLFISHNAHLILPYHQSLDLRSEELVGARKIGTTGRGIGPAYADKIDRVGIRMGDLMDKAGLKEKLSRNVKIKNTILKHVYHTEPVDENQIFDSLLAFQEKISGCVKDTTSLLHQWMKEGKRILLEGAQGTMLDIDFGTFPFVTSSNTTVGGISTGLGISLRKVDRVLGVIKAYTTRVGNGPFPTELTDALGEKLREVGGEYGATTGRPRRCGWLDGVVARYAVQINDIDVLAVTKLDVLDALEEILICTGYRYQDQIIHDFSLYTNVLDDVEPVYESLPGWMQPLSGIRKFGDLPDPAQKYLARMEEIVGIPIGLVSVGSSRKETIWVE